MFKFLLAIISSLYGCVVKVRNYLFDSGMIASTEYDIPIICVGNLTVGGTGKTPVSEMLISNLASKYNVALLSRGYKRRTKGYLEVTPEMGFLKVGDEPKQIKLKFPNIVVSVCEKRREGIAQIREDHPEVNLIILDDGFQHRYVEAWANIILMDYSRPIYHDKFLPLGNLRDSVAQLSRANIVIVTKCPSDMSSLQKRIVQSNLGLFPFQKLYFAEQIQGQLKPIFSEVADAQVRDGANVIAMSGIGNPSSFVASLRKRFNVVEQLSYPDHHPYRMRDLHKINSLLDASPEDTIIITTEKDAVKLTNGSRIPERIQKVLYYLPIEIRFQDSEQDMFLENILLYAKSNHKYNLLH